MSGKLIVIEGVDSSGKATQTKLLYENIKKITDKVTSIEFPNYKSKSSELVKMYLNGEFGKNANDVSPYMASVFFAADRVASYKTEWEKLLKNDEIIVADRYTTSNMIHQASKISDINEKEAFLKWVYDFEYNKLNLPVPDLTIFLDMPVKYAKILMENRLNKIDNSETKDIHESDTNYLNQSYDNAVYVAEMFKWERISCVENDKIKSIEEISNEILDKVLKLGI